MALNAGRARCLPLQSWLAHLTDALGRSANNVSVGKNGAGQRSVKRAIDVRALFECQVLHLQQ